MLVSVFPQDPLSTWALTSGSCVLNQHLVVSTEVLVASVLTCVPWVLRSSTLWRSFVSVVMLRLWAHVLRDSCNPSCVSSVQFLVEALTLPIDRQTVGHLWSPYVAVLSSWYPLFVPGNFIFSMASILFSNSLHLCLIILYIFRMASVGSWPVLTVVSGLVFILSAVAFTLASSLIKIATRYSKSTMIICHWFQV